MRRRGKTDANQSHVVETIRKLPGVSVHVTSGLGKGFPDLVVGFRGKNYLIELKDGAKSKSRKKLTEHEQRMKLKWFGQYDVCESVGEIFRVIGLTTTGGL